MIIPPVAPLIALQIATTNAQTAARNTESTSSYEQSRKIPMYSTSCCGDTTIQQDAMYCNIIPPQENLYCYTSYTTYSRV